VNGVLVKRIEMSQGANPTVILEQYGIEVAKQVGGRNSLIISTHNYPSITVCPSLQLIDQQIPLTVVAS
jgi:hypothetical protein